MRLPNSYGSVYKLKGNRRKPFVARKTLKWDLQNKKQKYVIIGYYEKREEALVALADYNTNPFNINRASITVKGVYEKWSEKKYTMVEASSIQAYKSAFVAVEEIHNMRFVDVKTNHLQLAMDNANKGYATNKKIKYLYSQLFAYAMQNDIVSKDYSKYVTPGKNTTKNTRVPFKSNEIKRLWDNVNNLEYVDSILIMIYTGFRIGELLELKTENIDLDSKTITGGFKTDAGKNRMVPIHDDILPLIERRYDSHNEFLFMWKTKNGDNKVLKYDNYYREKFTPIMEQLSMDHKPHDCRHTFATLLNKYEANPTSIKKLIGHSSYATTEKIYTHKDVEDLREAISKIKN